MSDNERKIIYIYIYIYVIYLLNPLKKEVTINNNKYFKGQLIKYLWFHLIMFKKKKRKENINLRSFFFFLIKLLLLILCNNYVEIVD